MDTGKAIFLGLALIALAIFATDITRPAQASLMGGGTFMGVSSGHFASVWVVNTDTGAARSCNDKGCDAWSK